MGVNEIKQEIGKYEHSIKLQQQALDMTACAGKAPEPQEPEEPEPPAKENKGGMGGLLVLLIVALAGGGGALYYFKLRKPKADVSGSSDLSEYDFDDEDEPEDGEMEGE